MRKWIVLFLVLSIVVLSNFQAQAASSRDTAEIAALKAELAKAKAQAEADRAADRARIDEIEKAIAQISENAAKDIEERSRLNKGIEENIVKLDKRADSTDASLLAFAKTQDLFAKRQEALEKGQYALAEKYDAAINVLAKPTEVRRKNQVVRSSGTVNVLRAQERKTREEAFTQALTMVGLDESDSILISLYAVHSHHGDNMSDFKRYLTAKGNEAKFDQIERAAKQLAKDGYFKLGEPQVAKIVRKDPPKPLSEEAKSALQLARESQYRAAERHRINPTQVVMPQRVVNKNIGKDKEDSDGFYTQVNWSSLLRR